MEIQLRLLTANEYMAMGACDVLHEDERLEQSERNVPGLSGIQVLCEN